MKPHRLFALPSFVFDRSGFTLIEVVVSVTILTSVAVAVTIATFQIFNTQEKWRAEVLATRDLRTVGATFATDALRAFTTTMADGTTASGTAMWWTNVSGETTTATFTLTGAAPPYTMVRMLVEEPVGSAPNLSEKELSTRVTTSTFTRAGKVITLELTVQAFRDEVKTTSLRAWMRNAD